MKKIKNWRTTTIGIFGMILIVAGFVLVYFEKATLTEVGTFGGMLSPILLGILSIFSKDAKVNSLDEMKKLLDEKNKPVV